MKFLSFDKTTVVVLKKHVGSLYRLTPIAYVSSELISVISNQNPFCDDGSISENGVLLKLTKEGGWFLVRGHVIYVTSRQVYITLLSLVKKIDS